MAIIAVAITSVDVDHAGANSLLVGYSVAAQAGGFSASVTVAFGSSQTLINNAVKSDAQTKAQQILGIQVAGTEVQLFGGAS